MGVLALEGAHDLYRITCEPTTYVFRHSGPPTELLEKFRLYYGPTMNAFAAADGNGRADELSNELATLFAAQNQGAADETIIPATFLKVMVRKPLSSGGGHDPGRLGREGKS